MAKKFKKPVKAANTAADAELGRNTKGFTDEERGAMKERAQELKAERAGKAGGESAVLAKIAEMPEPDRTMGERLHTIIKASAPGLSPRLWYGMPAYALDGTVVCFFQAASKFKTRYASFAFTDAAKLDEGNMWPTAFALKELTTDAEAKIGALIRRHEQDLARREAFEGERVDLAGEVEEGGLVCGRDQRDGDVVRFLEVVDRDGDVGPLDRVVIDADGSLEVGRVVTVAGHRLQALRDRLITTAGVEAERRLAGLFRLTLAVADGDLPQAAPLVGEVVALED